MQYNEPAKIGFLGVLNERGPKTIDAVRNLLQHNFERHWGFSMGVVSSTVRDLEEAGYVEATVDADGEYVHRITPAGEEHLRERIRGVFRDEDLFDFSNRHYVLITLGFLHHLPEDEQASVLDAVETQFAAELDHWTDVYATHERERDPVDDVVGYRRDLVRLNVTMLESLLEWVRGLEVKSPDGVGPDSH
jgi:DNA-binding PadR family transcriptional regulator